MMYDLYIYMNLSSVSIFFLRKVQYIILRLRNALKPGPIKITTIGRFLICSFFHLFWVHLSKWGNHDLLRIMINHIIKFFGGETASIHSYKVVIIRNNNNQIFCRKSAQPWSSLLVNKNGSKLIFWWTGLTNITN